MFQSSTLYYNWLRHDTLTSLNKKIASEEILYDYTDSAIVDTLKFRISLVESIEGQRERILSLVGRKIYTLFAVAGSTLRLITHIFLNILTGPFDRHSWYACAKNGEIALGYAIKLFNTECGALWIDLAKFNKDCYEHHRNTTISKKPSNASSSTTSLLKNVDLDKKQQEPTISNFKKKTWETKERFEQPIQKSSRESIEHEDGKAFNQIKETFKNVESLLKKLTRENIFKISSELKKIRQKIPIFGDSPLTNLSETEKSELKQIVCKSTNILTSINHLCGLINEPDLSIKRVALQKVPDPNIQKAFVQENANAVAEWYLNDLQLPEEKNMTQKAYAVEQLKALRKLLEECGVEDIQLFNRIKVRVNYLTESDTENAQKCIQNEDHDEIQKHFCELFTIYTETN